MKKEDMEKLREGWRRHLKEWEESGLSQAEYCRVNYLKVGQFVYWNRKFSGKKTVGPTFVQVPISSVTRFCPTRIEIGHRFCVEVGNGYDPAALEHIIGFLSRG